jgi:flagella basal body P-ring formation protein FlgA
MTKFINFILIITVIVGFSTIKANSAVLTSQFLSEKIKKDIVEQLSLSIKGQPVIEIDEIPYKSIEVSDGNIKINTIYNNNYFSSHSIVKADIIIDGVKEQSLIVPVNIKIYDNVWVVTEHIDRGRAFSGSNTAVERREIGSSAKYALRATVNPEGFLTRKTFRPGDVIDNRFIENAPVVKKESPVSVIFKADFVTVTMSAEAMDNGNVGDFIKVRNTRYKKNYIGRVISPNTVLVGI